MAEILPFLEIQESKENVSTSFDDFVHSMKTFKLDYVGQAIDSNGRICSLAWHPNSSKPILAVGGSKGTISKT